MSLILNDIGYLLLLFNYNIYTEKKKDQIFNYNNIFLGNI
jgi:hypothetical protein